MRKPLAAALVVATFSLPFSYALAAPQHGGGHAPATPPMTHENHDAHGDAVSTAAHAAKSEDANVGKAVSPVASDKNKGHRHHHHHH